jgi:peptide chain release factor subunit 3
MADEELNKKTEQLSVSGGETPKFSFKKMNTKATAFVPSWMPPPQAAAPAPAAAVSISLSSKPSTPAAPQESPKAVKAVKKEKVVEKVVEKKSEPAPVPIPDGPEEEIDLSGVQENMNVLFMGHVDAGKSTMGGHILLLTGMVDKRTVEQYKEKAKELGRESWYLSWALDLNQEERDKGKTTEYGRGTFVTEKRRYTIIDAPGHRSFVPSMIEGAAQADVGILVISARKGEFETGFEKDGQTREHVLLAKTAGVKKILMVINKMDDPTVEWSKERYDEIVSKMLPFMKSAGFGKNDVEVLPVSGFSGANMKDPLDPSVCDWYSGPPLLTVLDNIQIDRSNTGPFLMPIADRTKDMGTVAMGKIESGAVKKGSTLMIMPNKVILSHLESHRSPCHHD